MENIDWKQIGRILFIVGIAVAAVFALLEVDQPLEWLPIALTLVAILAAILYADHDDVLGIVIRFIGLGITADALYGFVKISEDPSYIGDYLSDIANGIYYNFLMPYVLTVVLISYWKKHFSK